MRFAIKVEDIISSTIIIDADSYEEAEEYIKNEYFKGNIIFDNDSRARISDDTDNYIEIFGENFYSLESIYDISSKDKQSELREYASKICDFVENLLDDNNITIPDDGRAGDAGEARLYGDSYFSLENKIMDVLNEMDNKLRK